MLSMIWNVSKWLIFAMAGTAVILWLRSFEATVQVQGVDWLPDYALRFDAVAIILAIAVGIIAVLYHAYKRLWMIPKLARERKEAQRQKSGYQAVSKGLVALAAGDADEASKQAKKAKDKLGNVGVAQLINAQSAQLKGDESAARRFFTDMIPEQETRFLALRGLVTQSMKEGRREEALLLAREAKAMQPDSQWALDALFELETKSGNMLEAEATVRKQRALAYLPAKDASHNRAVLLTQQAQNELAADKAAEAINKAKDAMALDPKLASTPLVLAKAQIAAGKKAAAASTLEKAWKKAPQEEMIATYLDAKNVGEDAHARRTALEKLAAKNQFAALSNVIRAELAIEEEKWEDARSHLDRAIENDPTERAFKLRAAVEQALTNDAEAVRAHLTRAINAKRDGTWVCGSCGNEPEAWSAVCRACDSFDTIQWSDDGHASEGMMPRLLAAPSGSPAELTLPSPTSSSGIKAAEASDAQVLVDANAADIAVVEPIDDADVSPKAGEKAPA